MIGWLMRRLIGFSDARPLRLLDLRMFVLAITDPRRHGQEGVFDPELSLLGHRSEARKQMRPDQFIRRVNRNEKPRNCISR
jgi:hypothetical protein